MSGMCVNSFRVAVENWSDDKRFEELLSLFSKYREAVDQIAFFTSITHPPLALDELKKRASVLAVRLKRVKALGFSCGINLLGTIGHHPEDLGFNLDGDSTRMTNINGEGNPGVFCMNDERFLDGYVKPVYTALAKASPDFIWIDDDVRYGHMPTGFGCFCDKCIEKFNSENGMSFTRETLKKALDADKDVSVRKKWLQFNRDSISGLFRAIDAAVCAVNPDIILGFMTGERYMEGYGFAEWADIISHHGEKSVMWRPGGGTYTDYNMNEMSDKADDIGRQVSLLPDYVKVIQSEIENFPYQLLKKSPRGTAFEAAMYIAAGCTGTAFNILPSETGESVGLAEPYLKEISGMLPFYKKLSETFGRSHTLGIHTGWCINSQAAVTGSFSGGYGGMYANYANELFGFGLPHCYDKDGACVTVLYKNAAAAYTEKELEKILSGGVYMDAQAVDYLNKKGYGELVGFSAGKRIYPDARERYTGHALNNGVSGGIRNCRQAFFDGESTELIPHDGAEILSSFIDYHGRELAACSCGVFENALGGRICAAGYYPFTWVSDTFKTAQLRRIFEWLSRNSLPAVVETYCRIKTTARRLDDGSVAVVLTNSGTETLHDVKVRIKNSSETATLTDCRCENALLRATEENENGKLFIAPELRPWEPVLIL